MEAQRKPETLVEVTKHQCGGYGTLKIQGVWGYDALPSHLARLGEVSVKGEDLRLDPKRVVVQHFDSGRTRPICEFLGSDNKCTRIMQATNRDCDRVFSYHLANLHSDTMSKRGKHCPFVVSPPAREIPIPSPEEILGH
ncbi:MAG: hypothetical protein US89_C0006G0077 [Candidatus Peregrinibacteria bacterium GW2011_GWF2_38_29]|nr:MAG: hypothetical protein US89_C0006G0077 [Candidatus Peregrinibacteria bacterium GW2011_GWF2_38_29]HBB03268.1 hypothetical protein [Candidatus Peregrinibacteria bacterium]